MPQVILQTLNFVNQQTHHHHLRLDAVTIYTAYEHTTQHKQFYQYFNIFYIDFKLLCKNLTLYMCTLH